MNDTIFIGRDAFYVNHGLLREERVGRQACHQVDREAGYRPMPGVFNLGHILEFVIDGLDQRSFPQEDLVRDGHDLPLHVVLELGNQLNAIYKEFGEEVLADVPFVSHQLSEDLLDEGLVPQRLPIIDIARCDHEVQQVSFLVADQVEFEAIKPSHRALSTLGETFEDFVEMDALVPANAQRGAVHEADARTGSHAALLHEQDERDGNLPLQFNEAVIGKGMREQVRHILANFIQVKVFQTFISTQVEQYHYRYYLSIGQHSLPMVLPLRLVPLGCESVNLDKSVINMAEVIRHTENFRNFVLGDRHSESVCVWFVVIPNLQKLSLFS